jgi:hypothetical protein
MKTIYPRKFLKYEKRFQGTRLVLENCPKKGNL